jgi:hypothetical protein
MRILIYGQYADQVGSNIFAGLREPVVIKLVIELALLAGILFCRFNDS